MKYLIFLSLLCFPFFTFAQDLNGKVLDLNGDGIPFANIILLNTDSVFIKGQISEEDGSFLISLEKAKTYILQISSLGYETLELPITSANTKEILTIDLKIDNRAIEEISVVAKKPLFVQKIDRMLVNVQNSVVSKGASILELLEKSPGVSVDRVNQRISLQGRDGIIVAFNGKQVRQDGAALFQLLEGTSSANVLNIELIHSPPASYDAQGDAGVININLLKQEEVGFNGNLSSNFAYGKKAKFGHSLTMNYKVKKLNVYAETNIDQNFTDQDISYQQNILFPSGRVHSSLDNKRPVSLGFHTGKLGIDYSINPNIELSSFLSGSLRRWNMDAFAETTFLELYDSILKEELVSQEKNYTNHYMWSNHFNINIDEKSSLSFDYDYLSYVSNNPTDYQLRRTFTNEIKEEEFNSTKKTPNDFHVARLDYAHNLNEKVEFETGLKLTIGQVQNTTSLNHTKPDKYSNPLFAEDVDLKESTYASYASFKIQLGNDISLLAGTRYEYNLLKVNSKTEGPLIDRKKGQFFPSINLSKKWESLSFTVSYNKRVSRPSFQTLAPSFYFLDTRTLLTGNIDILPTISNNVGLQINFRSINTSLRYTVQQNPIAWAQPIFLEEDAQFILKPINTIQRKLLSANVTFPINLSKIWSARLNVNATYVKDYFDYESKTMTTDGYSADANLSSNLLLPHDFELETSLVGNLRGYMGLITFAPRISANLGVSKKFKNDWRISLNWIDIFNQGTFFGLESRDFNEDIYYKWNYQLEGNIFRLTANIPFGNQKAKSEGRKETGSDDIQNRARN